MNRQQRRAAARRRGRSSDQSFRDETRTLAQPPGPMFVGTVGELTARNLAQLLAELDLDQIAAQARADTAAFHAEDWPGRAARRACDLLAAALSTPAESPEGST